MTLTRTKPLRQYRKKRRPGNRAPTKAEAARIVESKFGPCIPCLVWALAGCMPIEHVQIGGDYNHAKSGNIRRGHGAGFCGCGWHHRQVVPSGWTHEAMRTHYGPSLIDGSRVFHATYGSDDELIDLQSRVLALGSIDESTKRDLLALMETA